MESWSQPICFKKRVSCAVQLLQCVFIFIYGQIGWFPKQLLGQASKDVKHQTRPSWIGWLVAVKWLNQWRVETGSDGQTNRSVCCGTGEPITKLPGARPTSGFQGYLLALPRASCVLRRLKTITTTYRDNIQASRTCSITGSSLALQLPVVFSVSALFLSLSIVKPLLISPTSYSRLLS